MEMVVEKAVECLKKDNELMTVLKAINDRGELNEVLDRILGAFEAEQLAGRGGCQ